jgi:uncharacterized protein YehS (DUF1456 family)
LRYTFNFNDAKMVAIFKHAEVNVTREQICQWLKKEEDEGYVNCTDTQLATFLNGFIVEKRGKREGPMPAAESRLNNNIVLTKLKIALNLKAEDIIDLLAKTELKIGKSELSAFFRKPEHKHFRQCKDQFMRNFLHGLQDKYRQEKPSPQTNKSKPTGVKKAGTDKTVKTAKTIYVNPNATPVEKPKSTRKVLKLKPEDIWKS